MKVARFCTPCKAIALALAACGLGACVETDGLPVHQTAAESSCPTGSSKRKSVDKDVLAAFYPCCDGTAHYIPEFLVPADFRAMLAPGPGGSLCVPDDFASDADYTPKKCKSIFGRPGACMSVCIPQVANAPVKLPQDICPGNQLCAPCIDPQTEQATGACNQGAMACEPPPADDGTCTDYEPTLDISSYTSCCASGKAHCAPANLVSEKDRKDLQLCNDGTSFCVPDEFLTRGGRYTPPMCKSINGREGRCLSTCVEAVGKDSANLPQDICQAHEKCVPCYDPRTGLATGACGKGCDKGPVDGPKLFQPCGVGATDAFCVPGDYIPAADRPKFDTSGCLPKGQQCSEAGTLCVPKKIIDAGLTFSPKKCKASMPGMLAFIQQAFAGNWLGALTAISEYSDGRCLSKCIGQIKPDAGLLGKDSCDEGEVCAPCWDPRKVSQGKVPTGSMPHSAARSIPRPAFLVVACVVVLGLPGVARGGGTEVADNGGEAMGRGGAFVAKADNPAAINYNPAGLAKLRGYQATISANVVHAGIDFQRSGRTPFAKADGTETPYPLIENSQPWFAAPMHLMLTADFGLKWLTVAGGLYVPSAVGASYPVATKVDGRDVASPQRFMLANTEGNSQLLMFPSVAIGLHLHEKIDVGLSFQTAIYKVNFTQVATVSAACEKPEDPGCDVTINLDVSDYFSPTGSAGVLLRPFGGLELGAMVRLPSHAEMTGKAKAAFGPNVSKLNPHVTAPLLDPTEPSVSVTNDYPWMVRLGARYVFYSGDEEKADIEVDFTYERWSGVSERTVKIDGKSLGKPMDPVTMDMRLADTYGVRIGGSYRIRLARDLDLTLRAGVFGESETNDVSATNLQFLGPRRIGVAGGLGLRWGWARVDVAYAHLFLPERIVNNSTFTATDFGSKVPGPVVGNGVYNARVDALYLQLTAAYGSAPRAPRRVESEPAARPARREPKVDDLGFEVSDDPARKPRPGALEFDPEELSRSTGPASRPEVVATESPRAPRIAPRKRGGQRGTWKAHRGATPKGAVKHRRATRSKATRCRARDAAGRCVRISLQMR